MTARKTNIPGMKMRQIHLGLGASSLGTVLVALTEKGVAAILLGDDRDQLCRELQNQFPGARLVAADEEVDKAMVKIMRFIAAPASGLDLPLDPQGTEFQLLVWQKLQEIPPGTTVSYGEIARRLGMPKSVRAVARACAANALAVAIPCHRVVRNDGALAGYRWGIARKRALLAREAA